MRANNNENSKKRRLIISLLAVVLICVTVALSMIYFSRVSGEPAIFNAARSGFAMGSQLTGTVYGPSESECGELADKMLSECNALEAKISLRLPDSQTAAVNGADGGLFVSAPELKEILEVMIPLCELSGGRLDPTIAPVTELWDIDGLNPRLPEQSEIAELLPLVDYTKIDIKLDGDQVALGKGQQLDLGAAGKGMACDRMIELLKDTGATGGVAVVGGSVGLYKEKPERTDWVVEIQDPFDGSDVIGSLRFKDTAFISTSGSYEKYIERGGKRFHHILDATTGYPSESGLVSATVVADSGLLSDLLSTVCFMLGREESAKLLQNYGARAILVGEDRSVYISPSLKASFDLRLLADYSIHDL